MFQIFNRNGATRFMNSRLLLALPLCFAMTVHGLAQEPAKKQTKVVDVHIHVNGKPVLNHSHDDADHTHVADKDRAPIDVAILLDTSNSMDGLISQAKSQLWKIVQKFAKTEKNGALPKLRVSVFEYGNTNLPASEDYIRQVLPLCDDLDKVSEALFSLTTSGGDEYCGAVIGEAVKRLDWSKDDDAYKAIFIAGNERFTQGQSDYRETCARAIGGGIVVNTIHCGNQQTGINGKWADGARIGEGKSMNIDQDVKTAVHIHCPQDEVIIKLNTKLNSTYLWYGRKASRLALADNQMRQDLNNSIGQMGGMGGGGLGKGGGGGMGGDFGGRAGAKVSGLYRFEGKDLVDSAESNKNILGEVEEKALPEEMQKMAASERPGFLKKKAAERKQLQEQIKKLTAERAKYVAAERAKLAADSSEATFGDAMVEAVSEQLSERGFKDNSAGK